jgi:LPXTG-site transpeptidase (sortase) family protein
VVNAAVRSPGLAADIVSPDATIASRATQLRGVAQGALAVGVALILFVTYALYGTAIVEGRAQQSLSGLTHVRIASADVGLDSLVLASDSRGALAKGPGMVPRSGSPGSRAPLVIVGHRIANGGPFRHIGTLRAGSRLVVTSGGRTFNYDVERVVATTPDGVITESAGPQLLLLVSANPAYRDGGRLVVVARLIDATTSATGPAQTIRLPSLSGSPLDLLCALVVLAVIGLGWAFRASRPATLGRWGTSGSFVGAAILAYASWRLLLGSMSPLL